jgi:transposase
MEKVVKTFVSYTLHLAMSKMEQRKCLSEHPFGTIKKTLGAYYFLLRVK